MGYRTYSDSLRTPCFVPHVRYLGCPCDRCRGWQESSYTLNRAAAPEFCVVDTELAATDADNHLMSFPVRRSIKNPTGTTRRDFARRDWTSIGLRAARVSFGKARARTKLASPDRGLSYTHSEESRSIGLREPAPDLPLDSSAPSRDWRELLWIGLIMFAIAVAAASQ